MSLLVLLNIGHDISNFCAQLDRDIESARTSSALLKIILWPVHYSLVVVKILSKYIGQGTAQAYNHGIPETFADMRAHILASTPCSITCFNKTKFLLFVIDAYFIFFYFDKISIRPEFGYIYVICKLVMVALPFLALSPIDRLPFWVLGFALTVLEICVGLWLMTSWGYGINWENDHFYNHWKKHYRYRYASGNRQFTVELCQWAYPILKFLIFVDFVCWHKALQAFRALKRQHEAALLKAQKQQERTRGALDFGLSDFVTTADHSDAGITINVLLFGVVFVLFIFYLFLNMPVARECTQSTILFNCSSTSECSPGVGWCIVGAGVIGGIYIAPAIGLITMKAQALYFCFGVTYGAIRLIDSRFDAPEGNRPKSSSTKGALDLDFSYLSSLLEQDSVANLRYGILFLLALSSLGVYSIILAGWSSNSKYAFLGALRSAAQMISYEVAISLIILPIVLFAGSLNLTMITYIQSITVWFIWPLLPISVLFLIVMLAETNRTPFDLPEAEAELVAGYNVDYSSLPFAMFFLGEYCNMILISTLYCILFLSGGLNGFGLSPALLLSFKASLTWIYFVLVRATLPRFRYDQLMNLCWKYFLTIAGGFLPLVFGLLVYFNALPIANELPLTSTCSIVVLAFFARREPTAVKPAAATRVIGRMSVTSWSSTLWNSESACCCIAFGSALTLVAGGLWLYERAFSTPTPTEPWGGSGRIFYLCGETSRGCGSKK